MEAERYKEAGATILRNYGSFLKLQDKNFNEFSKRFDLIKLGKPNNKSFFPITVDITPFEEIHLLDIIESDNKILNKILAVFSALCQEIFFLQKEAKENFFYFIAFYGENFRESELSPEQFLSNHIENLHNLTAFVKRCQDIVVNMCNQICALFTCGLLNIKGLKLNYVLSYLGDILLILVTLDHLVEYSPIQRHWTAYRKSVKHLYQNPNKFNQNTENLKSIEIILNNIEERILSDKIFQNCLDALSNIKNKMVQKKGIQASEEFTNYLKISISDLEKSTVDIYESTSCIQWVKVNALFVFHFHVFGNADKKILKSLLDVNVKTHSVPLFGLVVWYPEQFLPRHANALCSNSNRLAQSIGKARQAYIATKKQNLPKDAYNAQLQSTRWTLEMNQTFAVGETHLNSAQMNHRMQLLNQGIKFASQINFIVTCFTSIHISQGLPITKNVLISICKLIEILKGLQRTFQRNYASIASSVNLIVQHLTFQIISKLVAARKSLMADKNYAKQRLDELTALVIAERALRGPITHQRRTVVNVALSLVPLQVFMEDGYTKIVTLLESVESIINIQSKMDVLCDCLFLYWNKSLVPIYLHNILSTKKDMSRLPIFFNALNDCTKALNNYGKYTSNKDFADKFYKEIDENFNDIVVKPMGQQIETNLRLQTHSHLQLDSLNPFTVPVEDIIPLLKIPGFKFHRSNLSIYNGIEHYLSSMFYNLTTVVLHDWKTYGEMRQLAQFKFELQTVEDKLPTQTLEQGVDVLEIMRNIHVFVSKYSYNLNNQIFIEQRSNNKSINTINITHIANSIRTHGTGIMNTTVNFTYQFLRKKFYTFSQFMYDEQIKSRLIKDLRHFRESGADTEQMYSYKRAEKFNKGIRNLGFDEDGQSYLDLFRILISHIGNAMGYVRMVRSGGLHCCANASAFLPSLEEEVSFGELLGEHAISEPMQEATKNLENTINNLTSNFSHGTEYFKLLVDVFAPVFRNPDNVHLKTFYMIVPPLTLNFVENILLCKDKMNKKNTTGAAFTDDGFAMGLAYILKLLDQDRGMDSLHWFQSVNKHIAQERKNVKDQLVKGSTQIHQALALTEKKLNVLEQEFQLLYFSFSSARIFFQ